VKYPAALLLLPALTLPAHALDIRVYNAAVHDRFTGYPSSPVMNPGFLYDASKFTGVGFHTTQGHLQFALISPRHFLCAAHVKPNPGDIVRFVAADGSVVQRTVTGTTTVNADNPGITDLSLGTLNATLPANVNPLPYLNLADEEDYEGKQIVVFGYGVISGTILRAGSGEISGIGNLDGDGPGGSYGNTRVAEFVYSASGTDPDDAHFTLTGGDSGSPSFVMEGGQPALTGIHFTVGPSGGDVHNFDTFVPHYTGDLDILLAPSGYRMRPAIFTPTTLGFSSSPTPSVLESGTAGSIDFTIENTGTETTGNLAATLSFAPSVSPASITASGCVVESLSAGVWSVRKAVVTAAEDVVITATWTAVPNASEFAASVAVESDTTTAATYPLTIPVAQTYDSWSQGLAQTGEDDDPDGDGWVNLLEYAFGSSGASGSFALPGGIAVRPAMVNEGGTVSLAYPERVHAGLLGLTYQVELSTDMDTDPWSTTLPAGAVSTTQPYVPAVPGFVKRTLSWPADGLRRFARVRVDRVE
jgi:hypothetical protein